MALHGSMAAVVALLLLLIWLFGRLGPLEFDTKWAEVDFNELEEVDLLRRYVRIDTSWTTGSEIAGAEFLAAELRRIGLEPTIETFGDRHANVWAIYEGRSPEALVLHSHIDVSPVDNPEAWDHPPYAAEIDQAWLYGRGVFDMKSLAIVQLLTLEKIIESGRTPEKSIVFLATGSEEVGSEMGTRWILEQHPELTERFWVALTEGGVVEVLNRREIKYWGIEFSQKQFASGYLCSDSRDELEAVRQQISIWQEDNERPQVVPDFRVFGREYGPTRGDTTYERAIVYPDRTILDEPLFRYIPPYLRALLRNEIALFDIEEAPGGGFRTRIIFHLLSGQDLESTRERLLPDWLVEGVGLTLAPALGSDHGSATDHPAFRQMREAVLSEYPDTTVGPYFLPWSATDSRFFRQAGIPSYGFSPFIIFNTETFRADGTNERMSLPGFMTGFELYHDAVRRIVD